MVPVGIKQGEREIFRKPVFGPADGIGLVAAHHQSPDLFFVIGESIGVAKCRQV